MKRIVKLIAILLVAVFTLSACSSNATININPSKINKSIQKYEVPEEDPSNFKDVKTEPSEKTYIRKVNSGDNGADTDSEENKTASNIKANDVIKVPVTESRYTESQLLPSVAYISGGVVQDYMFDGFAFTPATNFVYSHGTEDHGMAKLRKEQFQKLVDSIFTPGYNMDALENTVGQVKESVDDTEYKLEVFGSLLYPVRSVTDFGVVNGRNLNLSKFEDRIEAMKFLVDETISQFNARNYKHLKFAGFYYHIETLYDDEDVKLMKVVTDYVRSKGYGTIWAPYFNATGYNRWKEAGFDKATMQINYFPGNMSLPNAGKINRIGDAAAITNLAGMGIEMELCQPTSDPNFKLALGGLKEYMKYGAENGFMYEFHTYWIQDNFLTIRGMQKSSDTYIRSGYDELHKFIHRTLSAAEVIMQ